MTWKEGHRKEGYPCNSCCCHHGSSRGYHPSYSLAPLPSESCPLPLAALRRRLRRPRRHLGRLHGAVVEMWPFWLKQNRMQFQSMFHIWLLFPQLFYIAPTSFMLILMQTTSPASAAAATSAASTASASAAASPSPGVATASPDVAAASPELAAASPSTAVSGGSSSRITVASLRRNSGGDVSPCRNVNWAGKAPVFLMRSSWKQLESAGQVPEWMTWPQMNSDNNWGFFSAFSICKMQGCLPISRLAKKDGTKVHYGTSFSILQKWCEVEGRNEATDWVMKWDLGLWDLEKSRWSSAFWFFSDFLPTFLIVL